MSRSNGSAGVQRSLRGPSSGSTNHSPASPYHVANNSQQQPPQQQQQQQQQQQLTAATKHKDSMLDKFKLFNNNKDKDATRTKIGEFVVDLLLY